MRRFGVPAALASLLLAVIVSARCSAQITVYRDRYGVPSIVADRPADAIYGLGYTMAQDCAVQMARNFKQARGRLAEVDGKEQILADGFLRSLGIEAMAERKAQSLSGEQSELLHSFCDGANRALAQQKGRLPGWVEPFTPTDVLALAQLINAAFPLEQIAQRLLPGVGSNQFAVAPGRSADRHALLSMDPHLEWGGVFLWYEFSLYTRGMRFHGVTLSGEPFGIMGHTDRIAWSMTNNDPTLFTFYTVQTNPANSKQYSYHGQWRDFEETPIEIRYRDGDQLKTVRQTVKRTAWGPMVPFHAQAVRLSMLGSWDILDETLQMARARDVGQFRAALRPLGLSMWNIVYADTRGDIGYQYNARVPHLDASFDWSKAVAGADPKTAWGDWWTLDQLPHLERPKSGLLVNTNTAPWLTPLDDEIKRDGWPAYVTDYGSNTRYERLTSLLSTDDSVTPDSAMRDATDTQTPHATEAIRALQRAGSGDPEAAPPLAVLAKWDGRADIGSRGCALYLYWLRADRTASALAAKAGRGEEWSGAEAAAALAALKKGADALLQDHMRLDIPWGDIHYAQRGASIVPLSGFGYVVPGDGAAAVTPNGGRFTNGAIHCVFGSSFRMVVDLDPKGVRSWSVLPYGESQDPGSPHYADQMTLFARGGYKDTLFGLDRIRKEAASTTHLRRE